MRRDSFIAATFWMLTCLLIFSSTSYADDNNFSDQSHQCQEGVGGENILNLLKVEFSKIKDQNNPIHFYKFRTVIDQFVESAKSDDELLELTRAILTLEGQSLIPAQVAFVWFIETSNIIFVALESSKQGQTKSVFSNFIARIRKVADFLYLENLQAAFDVELKDNLVLNSFNQSKKANARKLQDEYLAVLESCFFYINNKLPIETYLESYVIPGELLAKRSLRERYVLVDKSIPSPRTFFGTLSGVWNQRFVETKEKINKPQFFKSVESDSAKRRAQIENFISNVKQLVVPPKSIEDGKLGNFEDDKEVLDSYLSILAKYSSAKVIEAELGSFNSISFLTFFENDENSDLKVQKRIDSINLHFAKYDYVVSLALAWQSVLTVAAEDFDYSVFDYLNLASDVDPVIFNLLLKFSNSPEIRDFSAQVLGENSSKL